MFEGYDDLPIQTKEGYQVSRCSPSGGFQTPGYSKKLDKKEENLFTGSEIKFTLNLKKILKLFKKTNQITLTVNVERSNTAHVDYYFVDTDMPKKTKPIQTFVFSTENGTWKDELGRTRNKFNLQFIMVQGVRS